MPIAKMVSIDEVISEQARLDNHPCVRRELRLRKRKVLRVIRQWPEAGMASTHGSGS